MIILVMRYGVFDKGVSQNGRDAKREFATQHTLYKSARADFLNFVLTLEDLWRVPAICLN